MTKIRLQKYLADAGVASRRKCEEFIASGLVEVNGVLITEPGTKVDGTEEIKLKGKSVKLTHKKIHILLNKPVGYISSTKDQFLRKTVVDLVGINERIYPVGRLDYDTSGLIILTNDGEFANILMHPRYETDKTYRAVIKGKLSGNETRMLENGIDIGGFITTPAKVRIVRSEEIKSIVEITIHEGKNRQVRKMFQAAGHTVVHLKRVAIGEISIEGLEEGKWRYLSKKEIESLIGSQFASIRESSGD
jgi:23S rRNA pseudouridine2605 synthase